MCGDTVFDFILCVAVVADTVLLLVPIAFILSNGSITKSLGKLPVTIS